MNTPVPESPSPDNAGTSASTRAPASTRTPASTVTVHRDAWGHLVVKDRNGQEYAGVAAIPLFPVTDPDRWISLVSSKGQEIALIEDLGQLEDAQRAIVHEELTFREFVPRIRRVSSVSAMTEPCEWQVETDRGQTTFVLKSEEDIRRLSVHTVQIVDGNGVRFRVDDTRLLDARSRRFIEWYV
jgi:hypothetical protein